MNQEKISSIKLLFNVLVSPGDSFDCIKNNKINKIIPVFIILVFLSFTYLLDLNLFTSFFHISVYPYFIYKLTILLGRKEIVFKKFYNIFILTFIPRLIILIVIKIFILVNEVGVILLSVGVLWQTILLIYALYHVYKIKISITLCIIILAGVFSAFINTITYGLIRRFFL